MGLILDSSVIIAAERRRDTAERLIEGIINATGDSSLGKVASDRLAWEGFIPQISPETPAYEAQTKLYDFTRQSKGSSLATLEAALRMNSGNVVVTPDPNRTVDFRVVLGGSYSSCTYNVALPK